MVTSPGWKIQAAIRKSWIRMRLDRCCSEVTANNRTAVGGAYFLPNSSWYLYDMGKFDFEMIRNSQKEAECWFLDLFKCSLHLPHWAENIANSKKVCHFLNSSASFLFLNRFKSNLCSLRGWIIYKVRNIWKKSWLIFRRRHAKIQTLSPVFE